MTLGGILDEVLVTPEGKRAKRGVNDLSCLYADTSIKSLKYRAQQALELVTMEVPENGMSEEGLGVPHPLHIHCPIHLFFLSVQLYPLSILSYLTGKHQ